MNLKDYIKGVDNLEYDPKDIIYGYLNKAKDINKASNAFVRFHDDYIANNYKELSKNLLRGAPIGVKDNFLTTGYVTSCCSKMLEDFVSPYSSTCFANIEKSGGVMIGKTNMDEFALGSSTENSYFGPTKNPYGNNKIPGGSSGGSAAAVASDTCIAAIGTDTGGSVRQPASMCGVVGVKPTYGKISRYGIQAMASSLDQAGTFTKTVEDAVILLNFMSSSDNKDATSISNQSYINLDNITHNTDLSGYKIAVIEENLKEGIDDEVKEVILKNIELAKSLGADIEYINMNILNYALAAYYIIMPAELSTNLERFDGIRFGYQENTFDYKNIYDYYANIRDKAFGSEVKRRSILGTYVLSAGYYDAYYLRAQKIRNKMKMEFDKIFDNFDAIIGPISPSVAWNIGDKVNDPLKMYLSDIYTIPANLCGLPSMSLPAGFVDNKLEKLPVGLNIMTNQWDEEKMFSIAYSIEQNL